MSETCKHPDAGKAESGEQVKDGQKVPDRNHALNVIAGELSNLYGWLPLTHRYSAAHEALAEVERRLGLPVGRDLFPRRGPLEPPQPPAPADDAEVSELGGLRAVRSAAEYLLLTHSLPAFGAQEQDMAWEGLVKALDYAGKPQSAPEPSDAATVLAGLREELAKTAINRDPSEDDERQIGFDDGQEWMLRRVVRKVEAAQQRLADRGQGGGSDG
jgi:hypothetical protein